MKKNRLSLAFLGLLIAASPLRAQDTLQNETVEQKDKRMEWFSQAKLGIFIHWGIYSVRGVSESWSFFNNYLPYDEYMEQEKGFTASKYDPKAWVDLIKESGAKAYTGDYTKSGYDRGHMAPAADMKWNKQAMEESFYMSNICPQNPNLNRGDWNDLEEKSRQWAKKYGAVYIACGPIYDTKRPKRIGNNKVAVPHAFYKVILINDKKNPQAIGFIFPNSAGHKPLKKYMVTVDSVEKRTDIDFFPALPDEIENRIEAELVQELP